MDLAALESVLREIVVYLDALLRVGSLLFGSLLFIPFSRFMRW